MARFSLSPPKAASTATATNNNPNGAVVKSPEFKWTFPPAQDEYSTTQNEQRYYQYHDNHYNNNIYDDDDDSSDSEEESSESLESSTTLVYNNNDPTVSSRDSEEGEEEPPHPLGFQQNYSRYGKTRFGPTIYDAVPPRTDIFNREDVMAWNTLLRVGLRSSSDGDGGNSGGGSGRSGSESNTSYYERQQTQSFPPINTGGYHLKNNCGVSTDRLIRGATAASTTLPSSSSSSAQDEMRELLLGMDRIANLVRAATYVGDDKEQQQQQRTTSSAASSISTSPYTQPRSTSKLLQLAKTCEQYQSTTLTTQMLQISQQRQHQYQKSHSKIQQLIQADISLANIAQERISSRQAIHDKLEKETKDKLERERRELERLHQIEIQKKHDEEEYQRAISEEKRLKELKRQEQVRHAEEEAERELQTRYAFVKRAQSLISNLDSLRSGGGGSGEGGDNTNTSLLRQFDKDKSVSKRRLQFKKVVNGKINTLSHECTKILDVGQIVSEAIVSAERDDAAAAATASGGGGVMTMGKKYLLDLLASNLIVRVQAGTFNGVRGDGFPLAGMIAYVSTQCEEIGPLLEAHLYSVCPTAIPMMSLESPGDGGGDEDEMMESLGMIRDKDGVFESFDKFLNRTEGLISIMADIMSSTPSEHKLLGGHEGAMIWLERFLDLLPEAPTKPLPLLTAPVLVAFLTGAGHMLANKFPTKMKPVFDTIQNDILNRLDESDVGVPSATRLRKVMDAGFDKLRSDLPPGAVAALYDGKPGTGTASASASRGGAAAGAAPNQQQQQQGFGDNSSSNPFSSSSNWGNVAPAPTPSGFAPAAPATNPSPFASNSQQPQATGFAAATPATNPSPFASASQQPQSSGFGQPPASSPFGVTPATSTSNQSPFGTQPPSTGFASSGFNSSSAAAPANSPFGTTQSSPFGNNMSNAPSPSPFGTNTNSNSSGFANTNDNRPPCKFFKEGKCKNGANCRFSHEATSGTGGGGFGGFGNQTNATQTPFSNQSSGFGGNNNNNNNNNNRPPCKFFAEGKCRNGANCKFSHDSGSGGAGGFGNQNSTFGGGGFGSAPAPSPFGGGSAPAPSPFGGGSAPAPAPSPFGGGGAAPAPSPFGGGGGFASAPAPSPFGGGGSAPAPSPFGGGGAAFGGGTAAPTPSPFGGGGATFGSGLAPAPSPFGGGGAAPAPSPFGGGFGGGAPSPFGSAMPNSNTPFGGPRR